MGGQRQRPGHRAPRIQRRHQLADAERSGYRHRRSSPGPAREGVTVISTSLCRYSSGCAGPAGSTARTTDAPSTPGHAWAPPRRNRRRRNRHAGKSPLPVLMNCLFRIPFPRGFVVSITPKLSTRGHGQSPTTGDRSHQVGGSESLFRGFRVTLRKKAPKKSFEIKQLHKTLDPLTESNQNNSRSRPGCKTHDQRYTARRNPLKC